MRTYETEVVNANALYTTMFGHSTRKYKDDDIIIAYAVWNLIVESPSHHEPPSFIGQTGTGKSQVHLNGSNFRKVSRKDH